MALATLGLVIFLRAATCGGVSGTAVSFALGSRGERRLDGGEIGRHGVKRARLVGGAGGLLEAMPGDDTDDEIGGADPAFAAKPCGDGDGRRRRRLAVDAGGPGEGDCAASSSASVALAAAPPVCRIAFRQRQPSWGAPTAMAWATVGSAVRGVTSSRPASKARVMGSAAAGWAATMRGAPRAQPSCTSSRQPFQHAVTPRPPPMGCSIQSGVSPRRSSHVSKA
mgnify:CR=1 FL=1